MRRATAALRGEGSVAAATMRSHGTKWAACSGGAPVAVVGQGGAVPRPWSGRLRVLAVADRGRCRALRGAARARRRPRPRGAPLASLRRDDVADDTAAAQVTAPTHPGRAQGRRCGGRRTCLTGSAGLGWPRAGVSGGSEMHFLQLPHPKVVEGLAFARPSPSFIGRRSRPLFGADQSRARARAINVATSTSHSRRSRSGRRSGRRGAPTATPTGTRRRPVRLAR